MSIINRGKEALNSMLDRKKEEREFQEKLDREARITERRIYADEYKKAALKAAMIRARSDAEKKSGLAKLRAVNALHQDPNAPRSNFFSKFSEYTKANMARREAAIKRAEALRTVGKQSRVDELTKRRMLREARVQSRSASRSLITNKPQPRPFSDLNDVFRR